MSDLMKRPDASLASTGGASAAGASRAMTVGQLEACLLSCFPAEDAESWDRTGLVVGDPACPVSKVAVALDPTVSAIKAAAAAGATVLVTHHPPFLDAPDTFKPAASVACVSGAGVWEAATKGVALMCFHTALDVSRQAQAMLPGILGLEQVGVLEATNPAQGKGYGQVCRFPQGQTMTLRGLASRCLAQFGRPGRVWGALDRPLETVVTATGAAGNLCGPAVEQGIDCLVCGELKYHAALDLSQAGVGIIELGHDVSELPLTVPLSAAVAASGIAESAIITLDQGANWTTPEAIRL